MPKDIHGKYHPPKGKPSDTRKEETNEELRNELTDDDASSTAGAARIGHPNRNTQKGREKHLPGDHQKAGGSNHGRTGKELKSETGEVIGKKPDELPGVIGHKGDEPDA